MTPRKGDSEARLRELVEEEEALLIRSVVLRIKADKVAGERARMRRRMGLPEEDQSMPPADVLAGLYEFYRPEIVPSWIDMWRDATPAEKEKLETAQRRWFDLARARRTT